jgi:hypothetical protein
MAYFQTVMEENETGDIEAVRRVAPKLDSFFPKVPVLMEEAWDEVVFIDSMDSGVASSTGPALPAVPPPAIPLATGPRDGRCFNRGQQKRNHRSTTEISR